jgi:hypothetical protein
VKLIDARASRTFTFGSPFARRNLVLAESWRARILYSIVGIWRQHERGDELRRLLDALWMRGAI